MGLILGLNSKESIMNRRANLTVSMTLSGASSAQSGTSSQFGTITYLRGTCYIVADVKTNRIIVSQSVIDFTMEDLGVFVIHPCIGLNIQANAPPAWMCSRCLPHQTLPLQQSQNEFSFMAHIPLLESITTGKLHQETEKWLT